MIELKREELLISELADLLVNDKHIAVGAASPIPGAAALLAKEEAKLQDDLVGSKDNLEGVAAFVEKRKAKFTGE